MLRGGRPTPGSSCAAGFQIGEVARRAGLSLGTVRSYEDAELLVPVGRTPTGAPLYDDDTVDRLLLITRMTPLGFTTADVRALLALRDELRGAAAAPQRRSELQDSLRTWTLLAEEKLAALRAQTSVAQSFVHSLRDGGLRNDGLRNDGLRNDVDAAQRVEGT